jgi:hypothetical protein
MIVESGGQCPRRIAVGGVLFCSQHAKMAEAAIAAASRSEVAPGGPSESHGTARRIAWEVTSATIAGLITLALQQLVGLFGPGDADQTAAKDALTAELLPGPVYPEMPDEYVAGARVDWIALRRIYDQKRTVDEAGGAGASAAGVEAAFLDWFDSMNEYHRSRLLGAVRASKTDID